LKALVRILTFYKLRTGKRKSESHHGLIGKGKSIAKRLSMERTLPCGGRK
jgi:hypothetical protein